MKRTPNEIGSDLERKVAEITQGRVTPQSGGGSFIKLDGSDKGGFAYSCKATDQKQISDAAMRGIQKLWREAVQGSRGPAGHGDGAKPAVVFGFDGEILVLTRLQDHADLATGEAEPYVRPSKADQRRAVINRSPMS